MAAEKQFENKIKAFLKSKGAWLIKYWAGAQFTKSGIPDLLICYKGHFIAVEVKAENGHPSELQLYNVKKIKEAGGHAFILYPNGFDDFKKFIESL